MLFLGMAFFLFLNSRGQSYSSSVGLRLSYGGLASYKQAINDENFLEGMVSVRWNGFVARGLFEWQNPLNTKNFFWYGGAGIHLGAHGRNNVFQPESGSNKIIQINLGMDLIGGVEYVFENFPLVVSADYKPAFSFTGTRWFIPEEFGLTARYILSY